MAAAPYTKFGFATPYKENNAPAMGSVVDGNAGRGVTLVASNGAG